MSEYIINWDENLVIDTFSKNSLREEIVRCRDCKHFTPEGTYKFENGKVNADCCDYVRGWMLQITPDGLCAWGERVVLESGHGTRPEERTQDEARL